MFETFGSELPLAARFFIAFLVVLALIGLTAWLVRRFGSSRLGGSSIRGRQPRLAVIDAASVDGRRRLVLIRRDNIEHLLMIGGPTDIVIEPNIVRAAARDAGVGREPAMRTEPTAWPLQPSNEPPAATPPRPPYRAPAATEEPWLPPEPGARPRPADAVNGAVSELPSRRPPEPARVSNERQELRVSPSAVASPAPDHNLAEMAQQLEAALRRAPALDGRPPVAGPIAAPASPPVSKPQEPPRTPIAEFKPRTEQKLEPKIEPKVAAKFEPKAEIKTDPTIETKFDRTTEIKIEPKIELAPGAKSQVQAVGQSTVSIQAPPLDKDLYDNLEEEMANLLGRPLGKS